MSESRRLTWSEIAERYPDQWVGLIDVEYEPNNDVTVKSAIVKYVDKDREELTILMVRSAGKLVMRYTPPDNCCQLGGLQL